MASLGTAISGDQTGEEECVILAVFAIAYLTFLLAYWHQPIEVYIIEDSDASFRLEFEK